MRLLYGATRWSGHPPDDVNRNRSLRRLAEQAAGRMPAPMVDGPVLLAAAGMFDPGSAAAAHRPVAFANGRYLLALDGWLADRVGLADALSVPTGTGMPRDGELVGAALARWGDAALERFHGQFALAWWDARDRRLLLACDRTGGRTFFYYQGGAGYCLRFASTVDLLLADPSIPRAVDPLALARDAISTELVGGRTCFTGIDQLPSAHKLTVTPAGCRVERYWRLDPHRKIRLSRDDDYVHAARELLDRVVREHTPAEGPVVAMMSSGLDSPGVTATAARQSAPAPVHAITMRPASGVPLPTDGRTVQDEWPLALRVADMHPNIRATAQEGPLGDVEDLLRSCLSLVGRPSVHLLAIPWFEPLWHKARQLGARAVLGGRSGNATLSATALSSHFRPNNLADVPGALADVISRVRRAPALGTMTAAMRGLAPSWLPAAYRRMAGKPPAWQSMTSLSPAVADMLGIEQIRREGALEYIDDIPFGLRWRMRVIEQTWTRSGMFSPLRVRRGIEYRDPLGDVRMAEFCFALPFDQFTRGREDRRLARRVLADRLPEPLLKQRLPGRQVAEWHHWMTALRPWMASHVDRLERSPLGQQLMDVPRLRAILETWPSGPDAAQARYYELSRVLVTGVTTGVFLRWAEGGND